MCIIKSSGPIIDPCGSPEHGENAGHAPFAPT